MLVDTESREDYDLAEKVKDVLRRGFEAILYLPKKMTYDPKSQRHYPAQLASKQVWLHRKALVFLSRRVKNVRYLGTYFLRWRVEASILSRLGRRDPAG